MKQRANPTVLITANMSVSDCILIDDGQAYEAWLKANPLGYVANTRMTRMTDGKSQFIIHRPGCYAITPKTEGDGSKFVERSYRKIVSESDLDLLSWGATEGFRNRWYCVKCIRLIDLRKTLKGSIPLHPASIDWAALEKDVTEKLNHNLKMPISVLELGDRDTSDLAELDILTVGQLVGYSEAELIETALRQQREEKGFSLRRLELIKSALFKGGLKFKDDKKAALKPESSGKDDIGRLKDDFKDEPDEKGKAPSGKTGGDGTEQHISTLGLTQAVFKLLKKNSIDTIEQLGAYSESDLLKLRGFSLVRIEEIESKLAGLAGKAGGILGGKTFCFTGALQRIDPRTGNGFTRKQIEELVKAKGGRLLNDVSSRLDHLVMADPASESSKAGKARKLEVNTLSEEEFFALIEKGGSPGSEPIKSQGEVSSTDRVVDGGEKAGKSALKKKAIPEVASLPEDLQEMLEWPVDVLCLGVRAMHCLEADGIQTIGQLVARSERDLLGIRHFGKTTLDEIKKQLLQRGFRLGGGSVAPGKSEANPSFESFQAITDFLYVPGVLRHYFQKNGIVCPEDLMLYRGPLAIGPAGKMQNLFQSLRSFYGEHGNAAVDGAIDPEQTLGSICAADLLPKAKLEGVDVTDVPVKDFISHALKDFSPPSPASPAGAASEPDPVKEASVDVLGLGVRAARCLEGEGIRTIGQLVVRREGDLLGIPNLGQTALNEIKERLLKIGRCLAGGADANTGDLAGFRYLLHLLVAGRVEPGSEDNQVALPPGMEGLAALGEHWHEMKWRDIGLELPARAVTFFEGCKIETLQEVAELVFTERYVCPKTGKWCWAIEYPNLGETTLSEIRDALGTLSELGLDKYRCGGSGKPTSAKDLSEVIFKALAEPGLRVLQGHCCSGKTDESMAEEMGVTQGRVQRIRSGALKRSKSRFRKYARDIFSRLQIRLDHSLSVDKEEALKLVGAEAVWQLDLAAAVAGRSFFSDRDSHVSRFNPEERVALQKLFSCAGEAEIQQLDDRGRVSLMELIPELLPIVYADSGSGKAYRLVKKCEKIIAERDFQIEWPGSDGNGKPGEGKDDGVLRLSGDWTRIRF